MQRLWIAVVALVGIGLAFFLFQRPDTGEAPAPDPSNTRPLDVDGAPAGTVRNPEMLTETRTKRPRSGKKEGMDRLMALRSQPDAVFAGKLIGPWTAIRYTLMKEYADDTEASEIAEAIKPHLQTLNQGRRDPTKQAPLGETADALDQLIEEIRGTDLMENETIASSVKRHDLTVGEFKNALANAGDDAEADEEAQ